MQEIINPYHPHQIPTSRRSFFGREGIASWLEQQFITRRRIFTLYGPPLIGKTTLLHFLPEMLTSRQVVFSFAFVGISEYSVRAFLVYLLQELTNQAVDRNMVSPQRLTTATDPVAALIEILKQVQQREPEAGILILIDDFDHLLEMDSDGADTILDIFQVMLREIPSLRFVLTTQETSLPRLNHPVLESAPTRQVPPLNTDDALQMITQPVEGVIRFDYGVPKRIAELNSNHPYYLNLFNQVMFSRYAREGWVNLRYLDETLDAVLEQDIPSFKEIWETATWVERAVLCALASVRGTHGLFNRQDVVQRLDKQANEQVIITALEALTFRGVLSKMGALSYKFYVDLFRYWLQKHYDLETVLKSVVWGQPAARPEPVSSPTPTDSSPTALTARNRLQLPFWMIVLAGITVLGLLIWGLLSLGGRDDVSDTQPESTEPAAAVRFSTSTPLLPTLTPTPEPTLTATPTPPRVVARSLPSIAYMARTQETPWQIYVMNTDGSGRRSISDLVADDATPVWSPQGNRLAFVSQRDGNREIYIVDVDGENLTNLTNHPANDWTPAWSPDGSKIAFSSDRQGNWEIFTVNPDGTDLRQITNTGTGNISPVWSPDGQYLAFSSRPDGDWEIYTMRLDGTEERRLTDNDVNDLAPVWSYSGDMIAYETNQEGNVEVFVMDRNGNNARNVTNLSSADDHGPVWSPNDQRLAFYSNREGNWDIYSIELDGSNVINLTNTADSDEQTPAWRP